MANLQVKDIDTRLYETLRSLATRQHRSISQEVIHILELYLASPRGSEKSPTEEFLKLCGAWTDDRSETAIAGEIRSGRRSSARFGGDRGLFD